ncbi:MAG: sulfurtransferase [Cyclobacteriaceae bacterium]
MVRVSSIIGLSFFLFWTITGCKPADQGNGNTIEPLIEAVQLSQVLNDQNVKVIDLRPLERYQDGHIPGAIQLWRTDIQDGTHNTRGIRASRSQLENLLQAKGLNDGDHIVIYDDKGDVDAARLWWLLKLYGYPTVSLLNGGWQAWKKNELGMTGAPESTPQEGNIRLKPLNQNLLVDQQKVLAAIGNKNYKIIDVRSAEEYSGQIQKSGAERPGRIPGSMFFEYSQTLDENAQFLHKTELTDLISKYNLDSQDSLIIYCQSGVRSSHLSFVLLELLGYQYVANYDGSWIEWSQNLQLPIESDSLSLTLN